MGIENFYQQSFPELNLNKQFHLREQSLEDTENFFKYYASPEVSQYILASTPKNTFEAESEIYYCRNLFRQKQGIYWAIAKRHKNEMVGAIGLYINNFHRRAELSYDLAKEYWGQGIMSKAIEIVRDYSFDQIGLSRIEAITMKENLASQRVLEKNGFKREGTLRNYKFYEGKPHNIEMFGTIPEDRA